MKKNSQKKTNPFPNVRIPSEIEVLLIRAAIDSGPTALKAWEEFQVQRTKSNHIRSEHRLLPFVYKNLKSIDGVSGLDSLKNIYQATLLKNQVLSLNLKLLIDKLQNESIPFILLKGFAVHLLYYRDLGLRPMSDIDFLVKIEDAPKTVDLLKRLGFSTWCSLSNYPDPHKHSTNFVNNLGINFDVHHHVLEAACWENADQGFWESSLEVDFDDRRIRVPSPAHLLLNMIGHELECTGAYSIQWVLDAASILRSGNIDWNVFIQESHKLGLTLTIKAVLNFLKTLELPVPEQVLHELDNIKVNWIERFAYRASAQENPAGAPFGLWTKIKLRVYQFGYFLKQANRPLNLTSIVTYVKAQIGVTRCSEIPKRIIYLYRMILEAGK